MGAVQGGRQMYVLSRTYIPLHMHTPHEQTVATTSMKDKAFDSTTPRKLILFADPVSSASSSAHRPPHGDRDRQRGRD